MFGLIIAAALVVLAVFMFVANQYKRCPSNKIIVVYGKTGGEKQQNVYTAAVHLLSR